MIASFDSFNKYEKPQFTLCNPGCFLGYSGALSNAVGVIQHTEAEENVFHFNAQSELSFRCSLPPEYLGDKVAVNIFKSIQNRRLIYQEGVGFFEITNVTKGYADGVDYKDVQAKSIEAELSHWKVPLVDGTRSFGDLLSSVVITVPLWTVDDNIDEALLSKYRTFEDVDTNKNVLAFMMDEMQEAYDCIFIFDTQHRIVHAYDKSTYVNETDIYVSIEDLIPSTTTDEDSEDLYTALSVSGENDITIHPVNPLGTGVIYNFDYYREWMRPELSHLVGEWQREISENEIRRQDEDIPSSINQMTYVELSERYSELLDTLNNLRMEIQQAEILRDMYQTCKDNLSKSAGKYVDINNIAIVTEGLQSLGG